MMVPSSRLTKDQLWPVALFIKERPRILPLLLAHKKKRRLQVGPLVTILFEDNFTLWWQVHEMLRIEQGGPSQAEEELQAYGSLFPEPGEIVLTLMVEANPPAYRRQVLRNLTNLENHLWLCFQDIILQATPVEGDSGTRDDGKTAAVHFLRIRIGQDVRKQLESLDEHAYCENPILLCIGQATYHHRATIPWSLFCMVRDAWYGPFLFPTQLDLEAV